MQDIQNLLDRSDDELLEQLGQELWTESAHATPATEQSLISEAKDWLRVNLPLAKEAVCKNSTVNAIRQKADTVTLASTIADIFLKSLGFPVPAVVAVLVLRIGLDKLCAE